VNGQTVIVFALLRNLLKSVQNLFASAHKIAGFRLPGFFIHVVPLSVAAGNCRAPGERG
jgi:hypothetical protein